MSSFKASPVLLHILAWVLFMTLPLLFMNEGGPMTDFDDAVLVAYLRFCALYMALFYLHTELLIPRLFLRKKYVSYGLALIVLLSLIVVIKPFDRLVSHRKHQTELGKQPFIHPRGFDGAPPYNQSFPPPRRFDKPDRQLTPPMHFDITGIFIFMMIIGLGSAIQTMKQWQISERRALLAEAQKTKAELSFLRAQINPHFLYNTLNNIYTLCVIGSDKAAESVMKLSKIMRYVTDESQADFVTLQEEIDCVSNFIDLQHLRLGKKVTLNYSVTGDPSRHRIAPLILMTFVENAFKYGLSNHLKASIDISIKVESDKIIFFVQNQIFERKEHLERDGIGIENTRRRLEYLYATAHTLSIDSSEQLFKVHLIINSKA